MPFFQAKKTAESRPDRNHEADQVPGVFQSSSLGSHPKKNTHVESLSRCTCPSKSATCSRRKTCRYRVKPLGMSAAAIKAEASHWNHTFDRTPSPLIQGRVRAVVEHVRNPKAAANAAIAANELACCFCQGQPHREVGGRNQIIHDNFI